MESKLLDIFIFWIIVQLMLLGYSTVEYLNTCKKDEVVVDKQLSEVVGAVFPLIFFMEIPDCPN